MKTETKGIQKFDLQSLAPLDRSKMKNVLGGAASTAPADETTELSVTVHTGGGANTTDH